MKTTRLNLAGAYMTREGTAPLPDFNRGGLHRAMEVISHDAAARTVELAFSSEYEGERWFGIEILDHSPASVRMDRIRDGGALLVGHDWDDQVGVVVSASIDADRRGRAVVRFGKSARAEEIFQDVIDGIRRHVSVGYRIHEAKLVETRSDGLDVYRITDWEPTEVSIVPVPFDHSVGVGRSMEKPQEEGAAQTSQTATVQSGAATGKPNSEEIRSMKIKVLRDASGNLVRAEVDENDSIVKVLEVLEKAGEGERSAEQRGRQAEQSRVRAINELGEKYDARDLALAAIGTGTSPEDFQRQLLDHVNTRSAAKPAQRAAENGGRSGTGSAPLNEQRSASIGLSDREVGQYSFFRAIRALQPNASRADREAAAFELECSEAAQRQYGRTAQGILVPDDVLSRAFNAGGAANTPAGATSGQNLVATNYMAGSFIDMLRNRTVLMQLATPMGGLVGNVEVPKQTGGATAYWLGTEGADATEGTPVIGQLEMSPKTVAAYTDITRKLLQQSTPDAEGITRRDLASAIAQAIDLAGFYGTGASGQPLGLTKHSGINAVTFAGTQPTYAELVQMESEIAADNADVGSMAYVLNAIGRGALKTTQKFTGTNGAPVWEPGNTVNGYRAEVTNQVTTGDVIFGNFADVLVGMWGGLDLTVDPYSLSRSGGLRIVVFQDIDVVLRRVESIAYGKKAAG